MLGERTSAYIHTLILMRCFIFSCHLFRRRRLPCSIDIDKTPLSRTTGRYSSPIPFPIVTSEYGWQYTHERTHSRRQLLHHPPDDTGEEDTSGNTNKENQ